MMAAPDFKGGGMTFEAAVLFSDASGFTALTERLAKHSGGAERLCHILNGFFAIMIDTIREYGGDIIKFAGDAVSIVFIVDDGKDDDPVTDTESRTLKEATLKAARCAQEIHHRLHMYPAVTDSDDPKKNCYLTLHMGLGAGLITAIHVGGLYGRWEFVTAGPPLKQIAVAEPLAHSGETVLSPEAWAVVKDEVKGREIQHATGTYLCITELLVDIQPCQDKLVDYKVEESTIKPLMAR